MLYDGGINRTLAALETETSEPHLLRQVYLSHGWTAVAEAVRSGDAAATAEKYPCLGGIAAIAIGIISLSGNPGSGRRSEIADLIELEPAATPAAIIEAIETQARQARLSILRHLGEDIVAITAPEIPGPAEWETIVRCGAENLPGAGGPRQLLVDVSEVGLRDAGTGIQRSPRTS